MRWCRVCVEGFGYELPEERITSRALERRLSAAWRALGLSEGQLEALTGIRERRWWPSGTLMADAASRAGRHALERTGVDPSDLGAVVYAGVCRDNLEPATACAVADALGVSEDAAVFDVNNACLGVMNGIIEVANRIELGQIRAGLIVSAESARRVNESAVARLNEFPSLELFRTSLATFTGGSGAVGVVLTDADLSYSGHRLVGGAMRSAPQHHRLCRWGPSSGLLGETVNVMETDAPGVMQNGLLLGLRTWRAFLQRLEWTVGEVDKVICHQVGSGHRQSMLERLEVSAERDYSTFATLGNMGTVSLPISLALAEEDGFFVPGERVALLGIGSGLNCLMLGLHW